MQEWFVLAPVALTSVAAVLLRWRRQADPGGALTAALAEAAETIGLAVLFFVANVGAGALVTLLARALNLGFISIYLSTDVTLLVFSVLQALVYQRWRDKLARPTP